jgi:wyosine [tRNA(Phe)-imidazoG37] synthetase (radical SAM superfamily)
VNLKAARYVYGPVPSRRLGRSLGVDLVPLKTCTWNCVYCQLGRTAKTTTQRRSYVPVADILAELRSALEREVAFPGAAPLQWVTLAGSGEPTLHSEIGAVIDGIKALTNTPVAVLTNGSLLHLPEVRTALHRADAVLPSLDAGSAHIFRRVNRPHPSLDFDRFLEGLVLFRQRFRGDIWAEVMVIKGLNDDQEAVADISRVLGRVQPDEVHLNIPVRPPAECWVEPPTAERLAEIEQSLGLTARQLVSSPATWNVSVAPGGLPQAVLSVLARHPLADTDIQNLFPGSPAEIEQSLRDLEADGLAQPVLRFGRRFWAPTGTHYCTEPTERRP